MQAIVETLFDTVWAHGSDPLTTFGSDPLTIHIATTLSFARNEVLPLAVAGRPDDQEQPLTARSEQNPKNTFQRAKYNVLMYVVGARVRLPYDTEYLPHNGYSPDLRNRDHFYNN